MKKIYYFKINTNIKYLQIEEVNFKKPYNKENKVKLKK